MKINNETLSKSTNESFCTRHFRQIKYTFRVLVLIDWIIEIALLLMCREHLIKVRYYYFIAAALPLNIYLFSWIFHEVVSWNDPSAEQDAKRYIHVAISPVPPFIHPFVMLLIFDLMFILYPLIYDFQCIQGERNLLITGIIIFFILFSVSLFCVRKQQGKIAQALLIAMISICISWSLTRAAFYAVSAPPVHYVTAVWDSRKVYNRGVSYYVYVLLSDGRRVRLKTSEEVYEATKDGGIVMISERTSIFDTKFVAVYLPE